MRPPTFALTRAVSDTLPECALTFQARAPIALPRAAAQHAGYRDALATSGLTVITLPAEHPLPDAVFVEDTAIVLDDVAVICRPALPTRVRETETVAALLGRFRPLEAIRAPATLEGGDVLRIDRTLYVGRSSRTNDAAIRQLRTIAEPRGYAVVVVPVSGCLHLKTGCTYVGEGTALVNRAWVDPAPFGGVRVIEVAADEPAAANTLRLGAKVLIQARFPRTRERLEQAGYDVIPLDISEFAKAEAGLTCMSIVFSAD